MRLPIIIILLIVSTSSAFDAGPFDVTFDLDENYAIGFVGNNSGISYDGVAYEAYRYIIFPEADEPIQLDVSEFEDIVIYDYATIYNFSIQQIKNKDCLPISEPYFRSVDNTTCAIIVGICTDGLISTIFYLADSSGWILEDGLRFQGQENATQFGRYAVWIFSYADSTTTNALLDSLTIRKKITQTG